MTHTNTAPRCHGIFASPPLKAATSHNAEETGRIYGIFASPPLKAATSHNAEETGRIYMGLLDRRVELDEADVVSFFGGNSGMAERFMTVAQEIRDEVGKDTGVTLRDVKRLEGAWIDFSTDTGGNLGEVGGGGEGGTGGLAREQRVARLASANRPPSYTHAIMKR
jgi:hypothetical protein